MSRRFRPTDAFVDESIRGQRYLFACVLLQVHDKPNIRSLVGGLAGSKRSRVHFNAEADGRRQELLRIFSELRIESFVVVCQRSHRSTEFEARSRCLSLIVTILQERSVERLVIESRQDDRNDERTIRRARRPEPVLVFEHQRGTDDALLWIADGIAWAVGAGERWAQELGTALTHVIEV